MRSRPEMRIWVFSPRPMMDSRVRGSLMGMVKLIRPSPSAGGHRRRHPALREGGRGAAPPVARSDRGEVVDEDLDLGSRPDRATADSRRNRPGRERRGREQEEPIGVSEPRVEAGEPVGFDLLGLALELDVHAGLEHAARGGREARADRAPVGIDALPEQALPQHQAVDTQEARVARDTEHGVETVQDRAGVCGIGRRRSWRQREDSRHGDQAENQAPASGCRAPRSTPVG